MTGAEAVIAAARSYIGVCESPPDSNNVIFNTEYYGRAVSGDAYPWCCVFVWYVFSVTGLSPLFYGGGKTASCTVLMNWAKSHGQFVSKGFQPGDLIFYNFSGDTGLAEHIGIATTAKVASVVTVEGNTGSASDTDGGEVMERERSLSYAIGALRPAYAADPIITQSQNKEEEDDMATRYNTLAELPSWAADAIKELIAGNFLQGSGARDEAGNPIDLDLSEDMLRVLVILVRIISSF